jgi:hypothetical protein
MQFTGHYYFKVKIRLSSPETPIFIAKWSLAAQATFLFLKFQAIYYKLPGWIFQNQG